MYHWNPTPSQQRLFDRGEAFYKLEHTATGNVVIVWDRDKHQATGETIREAMNKLEVKQLNDVWELPTYEDDDGYDPHNEFNADE